MEVDSTYLLAAVPGRCDDSEEQVYGGGQYLPSSGCAG